jgi:hypothetical protein
MVKCSKFLKYAMHVEDESVYEPISRVLEKHVQTCLLAQYENAREEVRCVNGNCRADIVISNEAGDPTMIVEIKRFRSAKHAIGQLMCYQNCFGAGLDLRLVVFAVPARSDAKMELLQQHCDRAHIELCVFDDSVLITNKIAHKRNATVGETESQKRKKRKN